MGYVAARKLSAGKVVRVIFSGLVVGLISSVMVAILAVITEPFNLRTMFVNASPDLVKILLFSRESLTIGLLISTGFLTGLSLLGALISLIPDLPRRMLWAGLGAVLFIGMLQELLDVILSRSDIVEPLAKFLFGRKGLSIGGTITVFVVFAGLNGLWISQGNNVSQGYARLPETQKRTINWVSIIVAVGLLLVLPQAVGPYISQILVLVGLYTLMGLGLNIEIGLAGLLDLGFVGFFAIGAYTTALLTSTSELGLDSVIVGEATRASYTSFWVAIPVSVAVAGLAGVFLGIPVLRMRGDYLAIVTLGFAEIIRILVLSDFLRPLLGGAQGILNIPKPVLNLVDFTIKDPGHFYYMIIIGCVIIAVIAWRLQFARVGRNWNAIREDEDVAEAMGINLIASKLLAFGIGAAFAGLSGAIFAAQVGSVFPHSFALLVSINVVCLVIIGGVASIPGVIVGALVLVGLPELLREFAEFRMLIYGALLVVMMLVKPEGFWPSEVRKRELHAGEEEVESRPTVSDPVLEATGTMST
jgi:branched-chain amino acid transport system permease protein